MRCIACDRYGVVLPDGCFVCNHCNIHIMPFRKGKSETLADMFRFVVVPRKTKSETEHEK